MRLVEFAQDQDSADRQLVALSELLKNQAETAGAQAKISLDGFLNLAHNMGINNLSKERLIDLSQQDPLKNVIANIANDEIYFVGAEQEPNSQETSPDENTKIVDRMANKQIKKGLTNPLA